jgi:hypothetical protein
VRSARTATLALLTSAASLAVAPAPLFALQFALTLERVEGPQYAAQDVTVRLDPKAGLVVAIDSLAAAGAQWKKLRLDCARPQMGATRLRCDDAVIEADGKLPLSFSYDRGTGAFDATLRPAAGEHWRVQTKQGAGRNEIRAEIENGALVRLARWLPAGWPRPGGGRLQGTAAYDADAARGQARLQVSGLGFSDAKGLRAGEAVAAIIDLAVQRQGAAWSWRAALDWRDGEIFWQPVYLKADGQKVLAAGRSEDGRTRVTQAALEWKALGGLRASGVWDQRAAAVLEADIEGERLALPLLYERILKPFLQGTALDDLRTDGAISASVQLRAGEVHAADVRFDRVSLEDRARRFALFNVNGRLPWHRREATMAEIAFDGGELLRLPFGAARLPLRMQGLRVEMREGKVPVLDGALTVRDFRAASGAGGSRWRFSAALEPVSMERITQSLGVTTMHGMLAADIPEVRYARSALSVDGTLQFRVFDGSIAVRNLELIEPFGRVPRLAADVDMRGLDLELLTRTFSFGTITGRVDASVAGLELSNWQPVRFDARIASSPGDYPRRISQAAVQNITALGGAGASAAIQRTFLRFFEQFGYERLGLTCTLRNNVCEMGGIEDAPQGYVIVKGGGIPAVSVIGYNRQVDWPELVSRLRRITQDNVRAVVK